MARVKKFEDGGLSSIGGYAKSAADPAAAAGGSTGPTSAPQVGSTLGGGGGTAGSASDGLSQINSGSQTVSDALNRAQTDLSGGFKKGGSVKKRSDGKINLSHCSVSTSSKNKKQSNW